MRRFWLEKPDWSGDSLQLTGDLLHHIRDVCRFGVGDRFELLAQGQAHLVEVRQMSKRDMEVLRLQARPLPDLPRPHIHLALSLPRFTKVDWIVEKSVELGVHTLHPFVSDYSFVRSLKDLPKGKVERWRKLVQQASQQSGRGQLMEIAEAKGLAELLAEINRQPRVLGLFPYEGDCPQTLRQALRGIRPGEWDEVWVFVGSEGGFSKEEVAQFRAQGLEPLSLGEQVLRVETACLALVSILKYEFEALD